MTPQVMPMLSPQVLEDMGAMQPQHKVIADIELHAKDAFATAFELAWVELLHGEWVRFVRQLGEEGRVLIGCGWDNPFLMSTIFGSHRYSFTRYTERSVQPTRLVLLRPGSNPLRARSTPNHRIQ